MSSPKLKKKYINDQNKKFVIITPKMGAKRKFMQYVSGIRFQNRNSNKITLEKKDKKLSHTLHASKTHVSR